MTMDVEEDIFGMSFVMPSEKICKIYSLSIQIEDEYRILAIEGMTVLHPPIKMWHY